MTGRKILIHNADWILTMNQKRQKYRRADMLVQGNIIAALGSGLLETQTYDEMIDARGKIVIPGMVNIHHHCAHTGRSAENRMHHLRGTSLYLSRGKSPHD